MALLEMQPVYLEREHEDLRSLILDGLEQIKQGKTKRADAVFDRMEKKYKDGSVRNQDD